MIEYIVQIIENSTGEVIKDMKAQNLRHVEQIHRGACINNNHTKFSMIIKEK